MDAMEREPMSFEARQRNAYREYFDSTDDKPDAARLSFEAWLMREFQWTQEALHGLYAKLSEYDMLDEMEVAAHQIDHDGIFNQPVEWPEVLGIIAAAKASLGIDYDEMEK